MKRFPVLPALLVALSVAACGTRGQLFLPPTQSPTKAAPAPSPSQPPSSSDKEAKDLSTPREVTR